MRRTRSSSSTFVETTSDRALRHQAGSRGPDSLVARLMRRTLPYAVAVSEADPDITIL